MGAAKRQQEATEHGTHLAALMAVEGGALKTCPHHDDVFLFVLDPQGYRHAYALATKRWKRGDLSCERVEFMALVKKAIDESAMACPMCANVLRD